MSKEPLFQDRSDQDLIIIEDSHKSVKFYIGRGILQSIVVYLAVLGSLLILNQLGFGNLIFYFQFVLFACLMFSWISGLMVVWFGPSPSFNDIKKYVNKDSKPLPVDTAYKLGLSRFILGISLLVIDSIYSFIIDLL